MQAAVTGLNPNATYRLALARDRADSYRDFESLGAFETNAARAAIVKTLGPLRPVVAGSPKPNGLR